MTKPTFQEIATAIFGGLLILVIVNLISEVGRTARWVTASPEERKVLILNDLSTQARDDLRWDKLTESERHIELIKSMDAFQFKRWQDTRKEQQPSPNVDTPPIAVAGAILTTVAVGLIISVLFCIGISTAPIR